MQQSCRTCRNTRRQMNICICRSTYRQSLRNIVGVLEGSDIIVDEEILGGSRLVVVEGCSGVVVLV